MPPREYNYDMDEIAKKVSEYQVFNFLLPGTIFAAAVTKTTDIDLVINNLLIAVFVYYFFGLVISRLGSIIIGPILRKTGIINFPPYSEYLEAVKKDDLLPTLSQENNTYRTLVSATLTYIVVFLIYVNRSHFSSTNRPLLVTLLALLLAGLFILSYRKQTNFIKKRIVKAKAK